MLSARSPGGLTTLFFFDRPKGDRLFESPELLGGILGPPEIGVGGIAALIDVLLYPLGHGDSTMLGTAHYP